MPIIAPICGICGTSADRDHLHERLGALEERVGPVDVLEALERVEPLRVRLEPVQVQLRADHHDVDRQRGDRARAHDRQQRQDDVLEDRHEDPLEAVGGDDLGMGAEPQRPVHRVAQLAGQPGPEHHQREQADEHDDRPGEVLRPRDRALLAGLLPFLGCRLLGLLTGHARSPP
jgi:hypothetical protein